MNLLTFLPYFFPCSSTSSHFVSFTGGQNKDLKGEEWMNHTHRDINEETRGFLDPTEATVKYSGLIHLMLL